MIRVHDTATAQEQDVQHTELIGMRNSCEGGTDSEEKLVSINYQYLLESKKIELTC